MVLLLPTSVFPSLLNWWDHFIDWFKCIKTVSHKTCEINIFQKSKEEKKAKKKKHKHEDKAADLLEVQADDLEVQPEETNEVAALPASASAEVHTQLSPAPWRGFTWDSPPE